MEVVLITVGEKEVLITVVMEVEAGGVVEVVAEAGYSCEII